MKERISISSSTSVVEKPNYVSQIPQLVRFLVDFDTDSESEELSKYRMVIQYLNSIPQEWILRRLSYMNMLDYYSRVKAILNQEPKEVQFLSLTQSAANDWNKNQLILKNDSRASICSENARRMKEIPSSVKVYWDIHELLKRNYTSEEIKEIYELFDLGPFVFSLMQRSSEVNYEDIIAWYYADNNLFLREVSSSYSVINF